MQGRVINGEYLWADHRADGNKLEVGSLNVRALHLLEWWNSWRRAKGGYRPLMRSWCELHSQSRSAGLVVSLSLAQIRLEPSFSLICFSSKEGKSHIRKRKRKKNAVLSGRTLTGHGFEYWRMGSVFFFFVFFFLFYFFFLVVEVTILLLRWSMSLKSRHILDKRRQRLVPININKQIRLVTSFGCVSFTHN